MWSIEVSLIEDHLSTVTDGATHSSVETGNRGFHTAAYLASVRRCAVPMNDRFTAPRPTKLMCIELSLQPYSDKVR